DGDDVPVWEVSAAVNMVSADASLSADGVYNRVVVFGENTADNAPPVSATAEITDPTDPLRVGGPFGTRTLTYSTDLVTTAPRAQVVANAMLPEARRLTRTVTLSSVPNPALDAGDRIRVVYGAVHPPE